MTPPDGQGSLINCFALVCYLPDPLAAFLDQIRHDFAPDSRARAHVTILPPRPLHPSPDPENIAAAWQEIMRQLRDVPPFRVELGDVEVFPDTHAIYVAIRAGHDELKRLHVLLNAGGVRFQESYPYHPHVTVAQDLAAEDVHAAAQYARWRWSEYAHDRHFTVDRVTFVRNTSEGFWTDLESVRLTSQVER